MNNLKINWTNSENYSFFNPRLPDEQKSLIQKNLSLVDLSHHIFLTSSGSSGKIKVAALSKESFMLSAQAVNEHLDISQKDSWLNVLPIFHVGGLSIFARGQASGSKVFDYSARPWNPIDYSESLTVHHAAWSSLVPAQIYDLVNHAIPSPPCLRGIIVGGGHLAEELHQRALALGWPLFPTYGMTECCSQAATAKDSSPNSGLIPLSHMKIKINPDGIIHIKSPSLLTGCLLCDPQEPKFYDPKIEGWFCTDDRGFFENGILKIFGRGENFIKIGGEGIDVSFLEKRWEEVCLKLCLSEDTALIDLADERLGRTIHLAKKGDEDLQDAIALFNSKVLPNAKIRKIHHVPMIPRSPLGKLLKSELRKLITE